MRKSLWMIPSLFLLAALGTPSAHADTVQYAISFSGTDAPTVVGSNVLNYDTTTDEFTTASFTISYFSNTYTELLIATPTNPQSDEYLWHAQSTGVPITDETIAMNVYNTISFGVPSGPNGPVTLTAVATPEPATSSLTLTGIGLLGLTWMVRRRTAPGLPQGS